MIDHEATRERLRTWASGVVLSEWAADLLVDVRVAAAVNDKMMHKLPDWIIHTHGHANSPLATATCLRCMLALRIDKGGLIQVYPEVKSG